MFSPLNCLPCSFPKRQEKGPLRSQKAPANAGDTVRFRPRTTERNHKVAGRFFFPQKGLGQRRSCVRMAPCQQNLRFSCAPTGVFAGAGAASGAGAAWAPPSGAASPVGPAATGFRQGEMEQCWVDKRRARAQKTEKDWFFSPYWFSIQPDRCSITSISLGPENLQ